ncbi:MAG: hypothetical protein ACRC1M_08065 [Methanobacteriaceae archaeon]
MSNEIVSKTLIYFILGAKLYNKEITTDTKKFISQKEEDEFWDNINKFSEEILHILKGAKTRPYTPKENRPDVENVEICLGHFERMTTNKKGSTKDVGIWARNVRTLSKIYGIKL